jgi:hypothetical protein
MLVETLLVLGLMLVLWLVVLDLLGLVHLLVLKVEVLQVKMVLEEDKLPVLESPLDEMLGFPLFNLLQHHFQNKNKVSGSA